MLPSPLQKLFQPSEPAPFGQRYLLPLASLMLPGKTNSAPWASGPGEILNHGLRLLKNDSDTNRRLAMISVDNAVELMIKTFLRLPKRITKLQITRKELEECGESFPNFLDALEKHAASRLQGINLGEIEWYHRLRNELYHQGNGLTVERDKVEVYSELAKLLFANLFGFELTDHENASHVGTFLAAWVMLEKLLVNKHPLPSPDDPLLMTDLVRNLQKLGELSGTELQEINSLRSLRNKVAHAKADDSDIFKEQGIQRVRHVIQVLQARWKME